MFDALTHLDFPAAEADRDGMLDRARIVGVTRWLVAGTEPTTWDRTADVARRTGGVAALGVHPWWAGTLS
ncbi:MAG: TatD family hydrolase, partial [Deltaproteobacteria bacterium]|nr:TatD family hydrolase [Deltaproteobacteria bacterium]